MAFTGHVLRGSSGKDAIQILEGKLEKKQHREDRDEWLDDIKEWTQIKTYEEIKNLAQDIFGELALRQSTFCSRRRHSWWWWYASKAAGLCYIVEHCNGHGSWVMLGAGSLQYSIFEWFNAWLFLIHNVIKARITHTHSCRDRQFVVNLFAFGSRRMQTVVNSRPKYIKRQWHTVAAGGNEQ